MLRETEPLLPEQEHELNLNGEAARSSSTRLPNRRRASHALSLPLETLPLPPPRSRSGAEEDQGKREKK